MHEPVYSPGLEGIVAGESSISTVSGSLQYRGYAIEDLAKNSSFEETAYLVLRGELPTSQELNSFRERLWAGGHVASEIFRILGTIPSKTPPIDVMRSAISLLAHWDADCQNNHCKANLRKAERLIAQLPVVMATYHRLAQKREPILPDKQKSVAENTLIMLGHNNPSASQVRALDVSLILYMEHGYNASTFSARVVSSTLSDLHASLAAAVGAIKGPLHGGANERVMEVLEKVGSAEKAEVWVRDALANKKRIMGFGHRIYKDGDPRATYLEGFCKKLAAETGKTSLETIAKVIESVVRQEKGLLPNLDWPSARLYHYLGLPIDLYTPLFVLSRVVGWSAHVVEQLEKNRLIRPTARYMGPASRRWIPEPDRSPIAISDQTQTG